MRFWFFSLALKRRRSLDETYEAIGEKLNFDLLAKNPIFRIFQQQLIKILETQYIL